MAFGAGGGRWGVGGACGGAGGRGTGDGEQWWSWERGDGVRPGGWGGMRGEDGDKLRPGVGEFGFED